MLTKNALRLGAVVLGCAVLALTLGGCKPVPAVVSTNPADGVTGVPVNTTVTATFSCKIDPDSINASTFTLFKGATQVSGQVSYDAGTLTATFTPDAPLDKNSLYTATIAKGAGAEKSVSQCVECYGPIVAVPIVIGIIAALAAPAPGLAEDHVWTFTTVAPDTPPIADAGPDQQLNLPVGAAAIDVTLDGSGSTDPEKSIVAYTWTGVPDPADVVQPTVSLGPGPHVFTLTVTDNDGLASEPDTVTINVNLPPVADAGVSGDQQVNIPPGAATAEVTLDSSLSHDPDGTVVAWAWTGDPDPDDVANPVVILGPGVHVFTLIVTDNLGAVSAPDTITITVNTPPVADAGPDQHINLPLLFSKTGKVAASTVDVTLDGSASYDTDGTIVSYAWSGSPDPADVVGPTVTLGAGDHVFSLVVTDDQGTVSVADTVTIFVNTPPVAEAGPDQHVSISPGASTVNVTLDGSGSFDTDGTIAVYSWSGTPDPAATVSPMVALTAGTHVFTLVVTDNDGAVSGVDAVTIYVNAPPVADAGPDQTVNLPMLAQTAAKAFASTIKVYLDGSGSYDPDGTIVSYAWTGTSDPEDIVNPAVTLGAGTYVFTLVVTDNEGAVSAADTVTITVNAPPVANAGPDQHVNLPIALQLGKDVNTVDVTLDGSASTDSDGTIVSYIWTGSPQPDDIVNPKVALGVGEHVFTLVVTDDDGLVSESDSVTIFVNSPPVADAGPDQNVSLPLGDTSMNVMLDGSASYDFDGTIASYTWTGTPGPANTVTPTVNLTAGDHVFTLIVTDNSGATSTADTVVISVNTPPVANAGLNRLYTLPFPEDKTPSIGTMPVTLDGSASTDSDGTITDYTWTGTPDPANEANPTLDLGAGVYTFVLVVTDNDGAVSAPSSVVITVNTPPVASAGPYRQIDLPVGITTADVTLDGSGSFDPDPAGSIVSYAWSGSPDPLDTVKPTVNLGPESHTFTLTVTDNYGATSLPSTVTIFVNQSPVANAGPDQRITLPDLQNKGTSLGMVTVTLNGSASYDPDGAIVSYVWSGPPDPADEANPTVDLGPGVYTFTLMVVDNNGASSIDTVTITVNTPPVANAGTDRHIDLPEGVTTTDVTLDGSASYDPDPAGTIASYAWTGSPDPDNLAKPTVTLGTGTHTFTLTVTDNYGAASLPSTVTITVNESPVANAGPDQFINLPMEPVKNGISGTVPVRLDGSASHDSDGSIVNYAWSGPPDPADEASPTVDLGPGVYTFTLVVTDDSGAASLPDSVTITVNTPPVADAGPYRQIDLPAGVLTTDVTLDGSASFDADGTIASYVWTGNPDPDNIEKPTVTLAPGTYVFTLVVTDNYGVESLPRTVTIFVNQTPVADAGEDQNLNLPLQTTKTLGQTMLVQLDGGGSHDPDGSIMTYTWAGTPDPEDIVNPTVLLGAGVHVFTLTVTDDSGAVSAADTVTITINTPPVARVTGTPNPTHADAQQPAVLTYDSSVLYGLQQHTEVVKQLSGGISLDYLDPADGTVTNSVPVVLAGYGWNVVNGYGLAVDPTTGTMWAIINTMDAGQSNHLLLATLDPLTGVAQYVAEYDSGVLPYDLACADDGTLYAVASSPLPKEVFTTPGLYSVDKTDGTLTGVLAFSDSSGYDAIAYLSALGRMVHIYRNTGDVPVLDIIDLGPLTGFAFPPAPPATAYLWAWPTALVIQAGSNTLFLSQDVDMTGELYTIQVTPGGGVDVLLNDSDPAYGGLAFGYTKKPVVQTVQLDGSTSFDPDGDAITYAWSLTSVPPGSAVTDVSNVAIVNPSLTPDVVGDYYVRLVVNDGKTDSAPFTYIVTYENTPPVADAGNDLVVPFDPMAEACVDGSASYDADCDPLTYSWVLTDGTGSPVPVIFYPSATSAAGCFTFSGTPAPGTYTATLTVTEDKSGGVSSTDSVTIKINAPPVANAGPDQAGDIPPGDTTVAVSLNGSLSSDTDGSIVSYVWTGTPDPLDEVNPTFSLGPGDYVFTLEVTDDNGATSTDTTTVKVNASPVANAGPDQEIFVDTPGPVSATLDGSGSSDIDGTIVSYTWSGDAATPPASANPLAPVTLGGPGVYNFSLSVLDDDGAFSAVDTVQIVVTLNEPL